MKLLFLLILLTLSFSITAKAEEATNSTSEVSNQPTIDTDKLLEELGQSQPKYNYGCLDPFEKYNRKMLKINMFFFRHLVIPWIFVIDSWMPKPITKGYINFMKNLLEPRNYIVHTLRKDKKQMKLTAKRFFLNTFFGVLGLINVAEKKYGNYSKTMSFDCFFRMNSKTGQYIVLPITNQYYTRSFGSSMIDWLFNPIFYFTIPWPYILYGMNQLVLLAPNKNLIYKYSKGDSGYEVLRDMETHDALNEDFCR